MSDYPWFVRREWKTLDEVRDMFAPTCEECGEPLTPEERAFYGHTCNDCARVQ